MKKTTCYLSHKLSGTQTRWSAVERRHLHINFALQIFDYHLHNAKFVIRSYHKPLKKVLKIRNK